MKLAVAVETSRKISTTRSRLRKTEFLAVFLRSLDRGETAIAVGFLVGEPRQGKIGVGWAMVQQALHSTGPATEPNLSLAEVDGAFSEIAKATGAGSTNLRKDLLGRLFARATEPERDFLARLILGELRQGALEAQMVEAIAVAAELPAELARRALTLAGDVRLVAQVAMTAGVPGLSRFNIQLFRPLQPMLAQTAEGVKEALQRLGAGAFEYKMDGARVQVHKAGRDVRVYTRNLNDVTAAVPEVVEATLRLPAREIILDGEALAFRSDGRPYPFQTTMRRFGRRLDVEKLRSSLPIRPFFFDCLYVDGESMIDFPGSGRSSSLREIVAETLLTPRLETTDESVAEDFLQSALAAGHEGVVAKSLEAVYDSGRRGAGWLKIKPSHTLDLVVLAVEWGSGRRRGWLSNLHLGARDRASGSFVMLGKTFKGMTDEMLTWQTKRLLELATAKEDHVVRVRPELVVEVAFNEVQESSRYPAGMALRFARVKRYRPDKTADEADTLETVKAIFKMGLH